MLKFLKKKRPRLLVLGLDGFAPDLVLSKWRNELPTFNRLMAEGAFGTLRSSVPCASIPAWNVMAAGKDAGTIGIYGQANHREGSYDDVKTAFGSASNEPPVWEIVSEAGRRVVVMGVPGSYPPRQVNGVQISCHLTPEMVITGADGRHRAAQFTFPQGLGEQIHQWIGGEYPLDVVKTPGQSLEDQIQQIYRMTETHFQVMRRLLNQQMWDFFLAVEIGAARLQECLWGHDTNCCASCDEALYEQQIRDYYRYIDSQLDQLMAQIDGDTAIMIVSNHGVQSAAGSICVNDWLAGEEWLTFIDTPPSQVQPFRAADIDWSKTLAWAEGGDFTRFFLNLEGRQQQGVIPWSRYLHMRDELIARILEVRGPNGEQLDTQIFKPEETYRHLHGTVPDLIVYWDNLRWRSIGDLGHSAIWTDEGAGSAAPMPNGLYIYWHPRQKMSGRELVGWEIMDIAPTILDYFQLPMPIEMQGRKIPLTANATSSMPPVMTDLQEQTQLSSTPRRPQRRKVKAKADKAQNVVRN